MVLDGSREKGSREVEEENENFTFMLFIETKQIYGTKIQMMIIKMIMVMTVMLMMMILKPGYPRVEAIQRSTWEGVQTNVTILKEACPILIEAQPWRRTLD